MGSAQIFCLHVPLQILVCLDVVLLGFAFSSLLGLASKELPLDTLLEKLSNGPRKVLKLPTIKIEEGEFAKLTLLDVHLKWQYNVESNISKSNNSPLFGQRLTGKSVGVINGEKVYFPS